MELQHSQPRKRGRPPKRPEDTLETRELLLRAGLEVLTEKGFAATGIDEVLKRVGVPKGSFYHYFDSKEAFGAALIDRYASYFALKLEWHGTTFAAVASSAISARRWQPCRRASESVLTPCLTTGSDVWPVVSKQRNNSARFLPRWTARNKPAFSGSAGK